MTLERRNDLVIDVNRDEARITDPTTGKTHILNPSAFAIWELCDGVTEIEAMVEAVVEVTGLPSEEADRQVRSTLDTLIRKGLVAP